MRFFSAKWIKTRKFVFKTFIVQCLQHALILLTFLLAFIGFLHTKNISHKRHEDQGSHSVDRNWSHFSHMSRDAPRLPYKTLYSSIFSSWLTSWAIWSRFFSAILSRRARYKNRKTGSARATHNSQTRLSENYTSFFSVLRLLKMKLKATHYWLLFEHVNVFVFIKASHFCSRKTWNEIIKLHKLKVVNSIKDSEEGFEYQHARELSETSSELRSGFVT